jgi:NitT/TauT family transport system permease protein
LTRLRRVWTFALALLLVAVVWELYKLIGPQDGGTVFGWTILPRANDTAMPHVWEMFPRYAQPENSASDTPILIVVLQGAWFTFRIALAGLALGTAVGLGSRSSWPGTRWSSAASCRTWSCRRRCR